MSRRPWVRVRRWLWPSEPPHRDWTSKQTGGREAREKAEADLERVRAETPYYVQLGNDARRIRAENHIGPDLLTALLPKGRGHA